MNQRNYANRWDSADIILTSLGNDEAVEQVYAELFAGQEVSYITRSACYELMRSRIRMIKVMGSCREEEGGLRSSSIRLP
jgi:hypothetical protein